jgi:hypothetical protein
MPSCAMGCTMGKSSTEKACMSSCDAAVKTKCKGFKFDNHTFNLCGSCPSGCSASDGVTECYLGCKFASGQKLDQIFVADVPEQLRELLKQRQSSKRRGFSLATSASGPNRSFWGLHTVPISLDQTPGVEVYDRWHTILPRARYPNRVASAGSREDAWARLGPNHSWASKPWQGFGHQHIYNATHAIPKTTTVFPDYFVYGVGGQCGKDGVGYDPPGAYLCSIHGGMHGGDYDSNTGKWRCPGCTDGYPAVFPESVQLGRPPLVNQTAFPHADHWDEDDIEDAVFRTVVNGWFSTMWQVMRRTWVACS